MARRLVVLCTLFALLASAASAGTGDWQRRQGQIQDKIDALQTRIHSASTREKVLTSQISLVTARIRALQGEVDRTTGKLHAIEGDLSIRKNRLAALTLKFRLQTERLNLLKRQYGVAQLRANRRLVAIYQEENPSTVDVLLSASSFSDFLDQLDYLGEIGTQDRRIAHQLATAKHNVAAARRGTDATRNRVAEAARTLQARFDEEMAARQRLVSVQTDLADARATKRETLAGVQENKREFVSEVDSLQQASRELAAKIQAAQASSTVSTGAPSASGLVWPVSGPVTSPFGWRWGRMHEGIDIGVPYGTPIGAAAAGVVIYAGWMSGYGNLVVIDHGGGLATAYGHQSSIAVSLGQHVEQRQVIGYVGCTGHCFGPHVHFEVRVNGQPVDPLGYL